MRVCGPMSVNTLCVSRHACAPVRSLRQPSWAHSHLACFHPAPSPFSPGDPHVGTLAPRSPLSVVGDQGPECVPLPGAWLCEVRWPMTPVSALCCCAVSHMSSHVNQAQKSLPVITALEKAMGYGRGGWAESSSPGEGSGLESFSHHRAR